MGVLDVTPHAAAYLASVVACLPAINKYEKEFLSALFSSESDDTPLMIKDIKAAVSTINYCNYDMLVQLSPNLFLSFQMLLQGLLNTPVFVGKKLVQQS